MRFPRTNPKPPPKKKRLRPALTTTKWRNAYALHGGHHAFKNDLEDGAFNRELTINRRLVQPPEVYDVIDDFDHVDHRELPVEDNPDLKEEMNDIDTTTDERSERSVKSWTIEIDDDPNRGRPRNAIYCAEPSPTTHRPDTPEPLQEDKVRAERKMGLKQHGIYLDYRNYLFTNTKHQKWLGTHSPREVDRGCRNRRGLILGVNHPSVSVKPFSEVDLICGTRKVHMKNCRGEPDLGTPETIIPRPPFSTLMLGSPRGWTKIKKPGHAMPDILKKKEDVTLKYYKTLPCINDQKLGIEPAPPKRKEMAGRRRQKCHLKSKLASTALPVIPSPIRTLRLGRVLGGNNQIQFGG